MRVVHAYAPHFTSICRPPHSYLAARAPDGGPADAHEIDGAALVEAGRAALPFTLTSGQDAALAHIRAQLRAPAPMMCLLQVPCAPTSYPGALQNSTIMNYITCSCKVWLPQGKPLVCFRCPVSPACQLWQVVGPQSSGAI